MGSEKLSISITTVANQEVADRLATSLLEQRLCACVNIIPGVSSRYWWQGKIEIEQEFMLIIKSRKSQTAKLQRALEQEHPYDTPEFISLKTAAVSEKYFEWVLAETKNG